jgi:hypothetical protein
MFTVWAVHSQQKQQTADPASHVPTSIKASQHLEREELNLKLRLH